MDIKVEIDGEAVRQQMVQAITNSVIGEQIAKAIDKALGKDQWTQARVVEQAVEEAVRITIRAIVAETIDQKREHVRAVVMERLTDEALATVTTRMMDYVIEGMRR